MKKPTIRFNLDLLPVTLIARQWYCEKAVDLSMRHPSIEALSVDMDIGTIGHEAAAAGAKTLSPRALKSEIESGKPMSLVEVPFTSSFKGVAIKGYPDYVAIGRGKAYLLLDYKFSKHRRIFAPHRVQTDLYGFLLGKNRLDTSSLICGIVILSPGLAGMGQADYITGQLKATADKMRKKGLERVFLDGDPDIWGELYRFSLNNTKRSLSWAMEYWMKKRAPKPTSKPYKCRICSFNAAGKCSTALAPFA